jgi:hypothetical protein
MVGKGIHAIHVLQQAGLTVWDEENDLARPSQLLSQFKISNHHNDQTTASKTCQAT